MVDSNKAVRMQALVIAAPLLFGAPISASSEEWIVTPLNPPGSIGSMAFAAFGGQQGGFAHVGGSAHASL